MPGVDERALIERADEGAHRGQLEEPRAGGDQKADRELNWGDVLDEIELAQRRQKLQVPLERRPGRERYEGGVENEPCLAEQVPDAQEVGPRVPLVQDLEDAIVDRLDRARDEQASGLAQLGQHPRVPDEVLDLDRHVIGDPRVLRVQGSGDLERMTGAIEEVRIPERDVLCARADLLPDVLEHDVPLDDAERPAVDGDDRAMAAQVPAAPAGLGVADGSRGSPGQHDSSIPSERRTPRSVGKLERLAVERDQRLDLTGSRCSRLGPGVRWKGGLDPAGGPRIGCGGEPAGEVREPLFEFASQNRLCAEAAQERLVHRGVEPVETEMRGGVERTDAGDDAGGDPRRGMHRHVDCDEVSGANRCGVEPIDGQILAADLRARSAQPRGWRCESERLATQVVGRKKKDPQRKLPRGSRYVG